MHRRALRLVYYGSICSTPCRLPRKGCGLSAERDPYAASKSCPLFPSAADDIDVKGLAYLTQGPPPVLDRRASQYNSGSMSIVDIDIS